MSNLEIEEVLNIKDEELELEFEKSIPAVGIQAKIKDMVSAVPNPISIGSWNSCTSACCCTLSDGATNAYLPNCTDCLPGGV